MTIDEITGRSRINSGIEETEAGLSRLIGVARDYVKDPTADKKAIAYNVLGQIRTFYNSLMKVPYNSLEGNGDPKTQVHSEIAEIQALLVPELGLAVNGLFNNERDAVLDTKRLESIQSVAARIIEKNKDYRLKLSIEDDFK